MTEATLQATRSTPSPKFAALESAALAFIAAQSHTPHLPTPLDHALLRRLVTLSYTHTFGPSYAVSQSPKLQGSFSIDAFIAHTGGLAPWLEGWEIRVRGVVVDEARECVVVRAGYGMDVAGEVVENEVVWWLEFEEGGGEAEWMVKRSTEIVDGIAAGRIKELVVVKKGDAVVAG
ncbi:hypothetical protein C7974DRAFT_89961 [Boeremia exigua]|uniref:uncharacterized protein n=1 Tax=Boeremia exigua TaxID=749465 RepID=UPI001E8CBF73|nr:uncharacterized protein C7974DRAFT_89961 [Boeremia exigua]KAH6612032.1 hypothetical protein C7974DRAFT_89961 [Boeremia exigua]